MSSDNCPFLEPPGRSVLCGALAGTWHGVRLPWAVAEVSIVPESVGVVITLKLRPPYHLRRVALGVAVSNQKELSSLQIC